MFFQHSDRKPFGSRNCVSFLRAQTLMSGEFPDVRQMLLKFVLGKAVHSSPLTKLDVN